MVNRITPPDQQQRDLALNVGGSYIVQAPAGSGKTTLLVERYLNLLMIVQRPEEILAITFTKAAAAEMKARILATLNEDSELAKRVSRRDDEMGWKIRYNPSRLKIQTIDSFAKELATQIPGLHSVSGMDIAKDAKPLYASAAQALLGQLYTNNPAQDYIADFLAMLDNNAVNAERLLVAMLSKRDQWIDLTSHLSRQASENFAQIASYVNAALEELHADILAPLHRAVTESDEAMLVTIADQTGLEPDWPSILPLLLTQKFELRKSLTKREHEAFLDKDFKALVAQWITDLGSRGLGSVLANYHQLPPFEISATDQERILVVSICLSLAAIELEKIFQRQRVIDFNGILMRAVTGLRDDDEPTDLALHWDYRIKHMLIDEFQDTSHSQYRFFSLLTEGWQPDDGNTFFAVGDPMQSIYRFRDADVAIFDQCRENGIGSTALTRLNLTANFRSCNTLVQWNNELFSDLLPAEGASRLGAVKFSAATPIQNDESATQLSCKYFSEEALEIQAIVVQIEKLIALDTKASIGILCRARNHLPDLLQALHAADIDTQGTDIDPLAKEPIVEDLMSLHRVLLQPSDRLSWFSLLRSPMIGALLKTLESLSGEEDISQIIDQWAITENEFARLNDALNWARPKLYEYPLCEVLEGCWVRLGGMDAYAEEKIVHAMRWFELLEAEGLNGYDCDQVNIAVNRLYAQPVQAAQVQIMTIHKSKGLEFDHVFLPFLSKRMQSDGTSLMLWQPSSEGLLVGVNGDAIHTWLKHEEKTRSDNERKRLLYVACTRAKTGLFVSFSKEDNKSAIGLAAHLENYASADTGRATVAISKAPSLVAENFPYKQQTEILPSKLLVRLPKDFSVNISGSGAQSESEINSVVAEAEENPASNPFELALGNLIHKALAWLGDSKALEQSADSALEKVRQRLATWTEQSGTDVNLWPQLEAQASLHLETTLLSESGQWILSSHKQAYCEWPLSGIIGNSLRHFILDRCFETDGRIWIIDYKSATPKADVDLEEFLQTECQRYSTQLDDYKTVVTALYDNDLPVVTALFFTGLGHLKEF